MFLASEVNYVSFPGISDTEAELHKTLFSFTIAGHTITIAWYGVLITLGIILAVTYVMLRGRKYRLLSDDLIDIAFCAVIPAIIGARLYYVFFDWLKNPDHYTNFIDVIAIWNGGLAIYGGLIFGAAGSLIALKVKKMRIPLFFDLMMPGVMLAQAIGRWGNFVNAEAYGAETTLPWRMRIRFGSGFVTEVHPTFLYESLWNLLGFALISIFWKKRRYDGQTSLFVFAWYGLGRMFIEGLRQDSLYLGSLRVSQVLAGILFVLCTALLIFFAIRFREKRLADCIYLPGSRSMKILAEKEAAEAAKEPAEDKSQEDGKTPGTAETADGGSENAAETAPEGTGQPSGKTDTEREEKE